MRFFSKQEIANLRERLFGEGLGLDDLLYVGELVRERYQEDVEPTYPFVETGKVTMQDYCDELDKAFGGIFLDKGTLTQLGNRATKEDSFGLLVTELLIEREAMERGFTYKVVREVLGVSGQEHLLRQRVREKYRQLYDEIRNQKEELKVHHLYLNPSSLEDKTLDMMVFKVRKAIYDTGTGNLVSKEDF